MQALKVVLGKHTGLAYKLGLSIVVSTAAIFSVLGYLNLGAHQRHSEELILQSADRISDIIRRSTRYQMLHNDREALYQTIRDMGSEPGIRRIRIFNKEGRISFSTDPKEAGSTVDKQAEACYGCHGKGTAIVRLDRPDRARIFREASGERVLGVIRPIENQPACSNADCHAHPAERRILGVIDSQLSLAAVDASLVTQQKQVMGLTAAALTLILLVAIVFVWRVVHKPIQELIAGTHRVAGGDLDYRLPVRSRDEIADLAESFNRMTGELAEARARLLAQTQNALAGSEKMAALGKLAATVAHEVNNPLFGILTYAKLCHKEVAKSSLDEETRKGLIEQLEVIERESRRCGEIMRNLLTFARQAPRRREPNQLNELVARAVRLMHHQFEIQGIDIETDLAPDLEAVECDAGQVQQIILVLLVNAAEAMPQGGRLRVSTEAVAADGVRLRVRDWGPGIPRDVMPHIFEPFFTTKEDQQRTGLGLAVAKSILDQHGGHIEVQSKEGEGAEFVITLPLGESVPAAEPAALMHEQSS
ncbi:MAG: HAMP domain-containing protein [Acidobacteriia bacterium]|nr:HAMP domain-containing protein [Terriglobia bacterium]